MAWSCGISIKFARIWYILDFCRLKIEGDIEANVKKMITAKVINSRFSRLKMSSRSNQYYSAEIGPTELYHIPN